METSLFRYIWRHSRGEQVKILLTVLLAMGFYFLSLNLPKTIVNEAIQGKVFPTEATRVAVLAVDIELPDWLGGASWHLFDGIALERIPYLLALSFAFLALVVVNNGFKYRINTTKGRLGERMLRRLRYELYDRILRFPLPHLRRVKAAEMATMIKDEVEPLGGFIGDAFVTPAMLGGQALTAMGFIMGQSLVLGSIALAIVLFQAFLVPKLRRPVLRLGRQRQLTARELAGRIAESVDGAREIRAAGTADYERASIADRLGRIFEIRFELYQRKFAAKLANNFLAQLTPFIFYAVGGYFAIRGDIDIGALVAVIAAYKDLPSPLKELIDWDQQRQDVQIKYEQVIDQFRAAAAPEPDQAPAPEVASLVGGAIVASGLGLADDGEARLLDGASFTATIGERIAVVGPEAGGKHELALVLAGLVQPTAGSLSLAGIELARAPESFRGRHLGYVGPESYLLPRSLHDNLVYGLQRVATREAATGEAPEKRRWRLAEAGRTGNSTADAHADWIDYAAAGLAGPEGLVQRLVAVLAAVELDAEVYAMGLRAIVDPARHPALAEAIPAIRAEVAARLARPDCRGLVERFDAEAYSQHASVAENLIFGVPVGSAFGLEGLADNAVVRQVLAQAGLADELVAIGLSTSATMVELFADLGPGNELFERYSFIRHDELPAYKALNARIARDGTAALTDEERARLTSLAFRLLPGHRLAGLDEAFQAKVVAARRLLRRNLPEAMRASIDFFEPRRYVAAASVLDNLLFGRIDESLGNAAPRVMAMLAELVGDLGLRPAIVGAGLEFNVGVGGRRLAAGQRQKVALARALLKRPDLLVVDDALAPLDGAAQARIAENVLALAEGRGVVWVLQRPGQAAPFGRVMVVDRGRVVETGDYPELARDGTRFQEMLLAS